MLRSAERARSACRVGSGPGRGAGRGPGPGFAPRSRRGIRTGWRRWIVAAPILLGALAGCGGDGGGRREPQPAAGGDSAHADARRAAGGEEAPVRGREDLFVERLGQGPPLWLVPDGPGVSHDYLHPSLEVFSSTFEVVFYDPRGAGGSPAADSYGLGEDVADLEAMRRALAVDRLQILGHGYGALVALRYAELHPQHTSTLVLVCPLVTREAFDGARRTLVARLDGAGERALASLRAGGPDRRLAEVLPPLVRHLLASSSSGLETSLLEATAIDVDVHRRAMARIFEHAPEPRRVLLPTLIIAGKRDVIPPAEIERLGADIHGSRVLLFEGSGHFPFVEEEARFAREVQAFLLEFDERRILGESGGAR